MTKKTIVLFFSALLVVALIIALFLYTKSKEVNPPIKPVPEDTNKFRDEQVIRDLNTFKAPESKKTDAQIIKELNSFKPPADRRTDEDILKELNSAPRPQ